MTEQKIVEILEDANYAVDIALLSNTITADKFNCAPIVALESDSPTGYTFHVGKNQLTDLNDAINFSKRRITD